MHGSRGCLGFYTKPRNVVSADGSSRRLRIQEQRAKNQSLRKDLWSTSSDDHMDNSALLSNKSISSISTPNQTVDTRSNAGRTIIPDEFVNHGFLCWTETRRQWVGNKGSQNLIQAQEPKLSWNASYDSLLGTNKAFPQPIPLPEMVDFLVDVWEEEDLYD